MRYSILFALFATQLIPAAFAAAPTSSSLSGWRPYADVELWEASDAIAVTKFEGNWSKGFSPREGPNTTLQRYRAGIGMESDHWSIGWEARQEASLDTDRATLDLVRLYKQQLNPAKDTQFDIRARFNGWSAQGLRVGHRFDGQNMAGGTPRLWVNVAFYTAPRLREDEVSGSAHYAQDGTYSFNATQIDASSHDQYPYMRNQPSASGASVSVAMNWPLTQTLAFNLRFEDLWSHIAWNNLPVMEKNINSDVTSRDSEGFINYSPELRGINHQVDKTVSIPRSYVALLSYRSGSWNIATQVEHWSGITMPTVSLARHFNWGSVSANIETRFRTVGLGFEYGNFGLAVQSDNLRLGRAKALGLHIGYRILSE